MTPPDGVPPDALRELVREVLRDVLPALANGGAPDGGAPPSGTPATFFAAPLAPPPAVPPAPPSGIPASSPPAHPARAYLVPAYLVPAYLAPGYLVPAYLAPGYPAPGYPAPGYPAPGYPAPGYPTPGRPAPAGPLAGPGGTVSRDGAALQPVRLATDEELHEFVLRVVALAGNPKRRRDLLAGRLRFTLAPAGPAAARLADAAPATPGPAGRVPATLTSADHPTSTPSDHRIEKGAVTERIVQAAASAGARLVLGPRAVLTPLARDRARALGVPIEKER